MRLKSIRLQGSHIRNNDDDDDRMMCLLKRQPDKKRGTPTNSMLRQVRKVSNSITQSLKVCSLRGGLFNGF